MINLSIAGPFLVDHQSVSNKSLINMISAIRSLKQILILLKENLTRRELGHFPYLLNFLNENPEMSKCDFKRFINEIEIVEREIHARFGEFYKH